jgi:phosphohistidine phosphatase
MQLYIMRHGEAHPPTNHSVMSDSERKLTKQGEFEAQLMAKWLAKMNISVGHLWVSPYIRAQQTCDIVSENMCVVAQTLDFITPSGEAKQVHDYIDGYIAQNGQATKPLFIVSHMPLVSYLVAELTNYQAAPIFATAAIAEVEYDVITMQGELVRLISPLDLC